MLKSLDHLRLTPESLNNPKKVAIIDVGSNSFRLIVITYQPHHYFKVTDEVRENVRLVHGLGATGKLSAPAMDHAVEVMQLYRSFCDSQKITDIVAAATSAVRDAANQAEFLRRVEDESGITVRVLSEAEEAYYGYVAAENSTILENGFVIDLGGGSLEVTRVENRRSVRAVSFPLGAVRMTEDWLPNAPPGKEALNTLRNHVRKHLDTISAWFKHEKGFRLVGQGGSLRNAGRLVQKMKGYPLDELHGYIVQRDDFQRMVKKMESLTISERRGIPGMKADRADIALGGALVVDECLRFSDSPQMIVCSQGVREGLFYERFLEGESPSLFENVRQASVMNMAHLYAFQAEHGDHVAALALSLFDQVARLTEDPLMTAAERELLWAACMLHDIGMNIDYNDHHRHSYYLILNSGLPGYSHRELALIALATLYHRKGKPSTGELSGVLETDDDRRLLKITACLRLAEQLDRSRDGAVREVKLRMRNDAAHLDIYANHDVAVSVWAAEQHADVFEAAFGSHLEIRRGG
ncbi:MAG TPA: Ppx/GppA phosphatase family protein [Aggregatilineales bacterium]|nr:Ppx/GppA family phosphatase [Anaerolineales bacterium]HRE47180.1 Ppx/GppA phosphatase family protein [Aggregatilineales bacterium]